VFEGVADALVQCALDESARRTDPRVFGARADDAVGLLAAHLLAVSPFGQQARLKSDAGNTTYNREWERLAAACAGGPWATGQGADGSLLP
jgi:hypothetical protein